MAVSYRSRRPSMRKSWWLGSVLVVSAIALSARTRDSRAAQAGQDLAGRFVSHAEHIQPGMAKPFAGLRLVNPHEGDKNAIVTGGKLFVAYNCVDCHGADGSGAMAPSLADGR